MPEEPTSLENADNPVTAPSRSARNPFGESLSPLPAPEERANILLVDDRLDTSLAMQTILGELGQNVVQANSGEEALRCLLETDFAVILLDVNMPGLDGFETAYLIRQRQSLEHTPIIFVTDISDTETHVTRGYSLGAVDYILTPVLPEVLRTKVSVFVELFKKNRQLKRQAEGLRQAHDLLEMRVNERTLQLAEANQKLLLEIAERQRAEDNIRQINAVLEQRVMERTAELAAANLELEAFTYSVAHDLQAPLRNILSYAELLQEEAASILPPEGAQYLQRIALRGKYMGQLIAGLLNLSVIGKQGLLRQRVDLNHVVDEVMAHLKAETDARGIQWRIHTLPAEACDVNLIKQVFANLLSNAVKYTRPRPQPVIEIGPTLVDNETAIYVRDNGVGFNMKHAGKLFGVFQRLHPAKTFEGTGVGLATVARIVRKHGGRVWAQAKENEGATFYFTIGRAGNASS
jgi:two-component system, sensor histidine kinase and response regulator